MKKFFGFIFKTIFRLIILCLIVVLVAIGINVWVIASTSDQIYAKSENMKIPKVDCIIVLGAGIWGDDPSPMLEDRLDLGVQLYQTEISDRMLMTGDHGKEDYDEVNVMKKYAVDRGIPSENVFMDHAGFSTYESIYRAKHIFGAKKVLIITQKYHLSRALYIANQFGLEAYGINSDPRVYEGQLMRDLRELLARDKDFFKCIIKPEPTYLGEEIPITGNGDVTNDKDIFNVPNTNSEVETNYPVEETIPNEELTNDYYQEDIQNTGIENIFDNIIEEETQATSNEEVIIDSSENDINSFDAKEIFDYNFDDETITTYDE